MVIGAYKVTTVERIIKALPERRAIFLKEYALAIEDYRDSMIYPSYRFGSDNRVVQELESNVKEDDLLRELNYHIDKALMSAAQCDYYYRFEKEW